MTLKQSPAWQALEQHYQTLKNVHMRDLFAQDPLRFPTFTLESGAIFLDYSKNRITNETLSLLCKLAEQVKLDVAARGMFEGEKINFTEQRAVLHTALRRSGDQPLYLDGTDIIPHIKTVLAKMRQFCDAVHAHTWLGYSGKPVTDIVNIGIGGSHLGPYMVTRALKPLRKPNLKVHFVSNVDSTDIYEVLEQVNAETTLFIIASKTFTTLETMANANSARNWFLDKVRDDKAIAKHFVALSTNLAATATFGIQDHNVFEFWDWVGGRYSLWSAIGLPIALYIGMDNFDRLLAGAYQMDQHFSTAPLNKNLPVIMGLLGIWYNNFFGAQTRGVIPYDQHLEHLPAYLQQLEMESNGKRIDATGCATDYSTAQIVWGEPGTNGQHAFFQLLHQGTGLVPIDLLAPMRSSTPLGDHQDLLIANCFAQSEAFMKGKTEDQVRLELESAKMNTMQIQRLLPHKVFPGNVPTNTILYPELTPEVLGNLIALYEHKVFVEGKIWNINSFDQWGVELGKQLASQIIKELQSTDNLTHHDASTSGLIERYRQFLNAQ